MVDLPATGEAAAPPPSSTTVVDLEIGEAAVKVAPAAARRRSWEEMPHRTRVWIKVSQGTLLVSIFFYLGLFVKFQANVLSVILLEHLVTLFYVGFVCYLTSVAREPYVLPPSDKLSVESAFVVASFCWTFLLMNDDIFTAILGLILIFKVIPVINLWWEFTNFDFWDCCFVVLIDAAFVCCRYFGGVALMMAVAGLGVALHFIKDAYRQYDSYRMFKNETCKHLISSMKRAYSWPRYCWYRWCTGGVDDGGFTEILF